MLRMVFVSLIVLFGIGASIVSPFFALLFYLWNAYFRPEEWTFGGTIRSLNLSFQIGSYLVLATAASLPRFRFNLRVALLGLFFAQSLLSTLYSEHYEYSWNAWTEFAKVLIVSYVIILLTSSDRNRYRQVLFIIGISLGFECAKQGWVQLFRAPGAQNNNTIAFLGDNNGVAVGTMMLVPILSALAQTTSRKWEVFMHRFLLIGVFMRGITTYSRGGFLSAAVLGLFSLARSQRKFRALIGAGVLVALVASVMPQQFWDRMNTINASNSERDDSALGRLHFWVIARQMAAEKPVTGIGFSAYNLSYERYNGPTEYGEFSGVRSVHSVWFGALSEMGYPGLFLLVAMLVTSMVSCWRISWSMRHQPENRDLRIYANALMTSLASFAVGGTFLPLQYNEMFWHFMALSVALSFLAQEQPVQVPAPTVVPAAPAFGHMPHGAVPRGQLPQGQLPPRRLPQPLPR
jgi:probable O-glycosylation ligase (exosortase A-associated)